MPSKKRAGHVCVVKVLVFTDIFENYTNKTSKYHSMPLLKCFPRTICVNKIKAFFHKKSYFFLKQGIKKNFGGKKIFFSRNNEKNYYFFRAPEEKSSQRRPPEILKISFQKLRLRTKFSKTTSQMRSLRIILESNRGAASNKKGGRATGLNTRVTYTLYGGQHLNYGQTNLGH